MDVATGFVSPSLPKPAGTLVIPSPYGRVSAHDRRKEHRMSPTRSQRGNGATSDSEANGSVGVARGTPDRPYDYDWIVIGSGFGGAVSALRLAEKGYRVAVIEQGRRFQDHELPDSTRDLRDFLWAPQSGARGILRVVPYKDVDSYDQRRRRRRQPRLLPGIAAAASAGLQRPAMGRDRRLGVGPRAALRDGRADARRGDGAVR